MSRQLPSELSPDMRRARHLEYWTLFWMALTVCVMFFVMGSSQAMKTAWIEDLLSLIPAIVFLVAAKFETKTATDKFRYGFHRVNSLAFLIAAVALLAVGAFLLFEAILTLVKQERPSIGSVTIFGKQVWLGWVMIATLAYSVIPQVILGKLKQPIARRLQDKVLYTDALMQKADWMTGVAAIGGILGVGAGLWWADAAAAGFISFEVLRDGIKGVGIASAELIDGMPRELDSDDIAQDARRLEQSLAVAYPGAIIKLRETGRFIIAQIEMDDIDLPTGVDVIHKPEREWRLDTLSFTEKTGEAWAHENGLRED